MEQKDIYNTLRTATKKKTILQLNLIPLSDKIYLIDVELR